MASIQKRTTNKGRVRYRAQVRVKGNPTQSATFLKKSEAALWAQEREAELKLGKTSLSPLPLPPTEHSLAELTDRYTKEVLPQKKDQNPILSHAFTIAWKEWQWIDRNPVTHIRKLKEPGGRVRFLDNDERKRLLKECDESRNPYLYTIVVLPCLAHFHDPPLIINRS